MLDNLVSRLSPSDRNENTGVGGLLSYMLYFTILCIGRTYNTTLVACYGPSYISSPPVGHGPSLPRQERTNSLRDEMLSFL